jgi:hypothetical protein
VKKIKLIRYEEGAVPLDAVASAVKFEDAILIAAGLVKYPGDQRLGAIISSKIESHTFMVRHNPNCPSPYEVRLCGAYPRIDGLEARTESNDAIGCGKDLTEAFENALKAQKEFKKFRTSSSATSPEWIRTRRVNLQEEIRIKDDKIEALERNIREIAAAALSRTVGAEDIATLVGATLDRISELAKAEKGFDKILEVLRAEGKR